MFDTLKSWLLSLTPTQIQVYTALTGTLALGMSLVVFIYNVYKDWTKIRIEIKRDSDSPLATHYTWQEILLIQTMNKSSSSVIINEVGVVVQRKKYINFVDMLEILSIDNKLMEKEIIGNVEWTRIPGTVNPGSMGAVIILFSNLEKTYKTIEEGKELPSNKSKYLQKRKLTDAYEKLMKSCNASTKVLTVKPYIVTATGQRFIGKETKIQLGNLMKR